jgi:hypothetical protein
MIDERTFYSTLGLYADVIESIIGANLSRRDTIDFPTLVVAEKCAAAATALGACIRIWDRDRREDAATELQRVMHLIDALAWQISERVVYAMPAAPGASIRCAELCDERAIFTTHAIDKNTGELKIIYFDVASNGWEVACAPSA